MTDEEEEKKVLNLPFTLRLTESAVFVVNERRRRSLFIGFQNLPSLSFEKI